MLYGVGPHDAVALGDATILMATTAFAAAFIPARRLLRLDVVQAVRDA